MIEYDPNGHDGEEHDLTPPADLPEHHLDDRFDAPMTPLDDLGSDAGTPPDALHFPGDGDMTVDDPAPDMDPVADPGAPYPDDTGFSDWLTGSEPTGPDDDPAADADLRDKLAPPPEDPGDLPTSDSLVDWTMRRMDA
jgi:hypothetical protein